MEIIWKPCKYYEDRFEVSNTGKVRRVKDGFEYKLYIGTHGYLMVDFWLNGKSKKELVHRLVALTFLDKPEECNFVNHKDENKLNNNVDNLEWCTKSYNRTYGTTSERCREHALDNFENYAKVNQYDLEGKWLATYRSIREAGRILGFSNSYLSKKLKEGKGECEVFGYKWVVINGYYA